MSQVVQAIFAFLYAIYSYSGNITLCRRLFFRNLQESAMSHTITNNTNKETTTVSLRDLIGRRNFTRAKLLPTPNLVKMMKEEIEYVMF